MPAGHNLQTKASPALRQAVSKLMEDAGLNQAQAVRLLLDRGLSLSPTEEGIALREGIFQGQGILFKCMTVVQRWIIMEGERTSWNTKEMLTAADRLLKLLDVK